MTEIRNRPGINSGTMFNQKTNEDFNKKKPNPTDPNEQKGRVTTVTPDFGNDSDDLEKGRRTTIIPDFSDPDLKPLESETPDEMGNWKKAADTSAGSE